MIICWGQKFVNAAALFEHPRCYTSTLHVLRKRLLTLPPEEAVFPPYFRLCGKKYETIYQLHHYGCGDVVSMAALYKRLGLIHNGRKVTPEQATCPQIWTRLKALNRSGTYGTVLI
jgi:hypothetical protein